MANKKSKIDKIDPGRPKNYKNWQVEGKKAKKKQGCRIH